MSDRITESERAAIAAYLASGGKVVRCMDGEAMGAHMGWGAGDYEIWLSRQNINVVPLREPNFVHRLHEVMVGRGVGVDAIFKHAA